MGEGGIAAIPIRYMVVSSLFGMKYLVMDTSFEGQGRTVAKCDKIEDASMVCDALNTCFGHPMGSGFMPGPDEYSASLGALYS